MSSLTIMSTLIRRELRTAARTRSYYLLGLAVGGILLGLTFGGGGAATGYIPTVVDLLLPLEVLVPIVAVAIGYRAVPSDLDRGEVAMLDTYAVSPSAYVGAVYLGRAAVLSAIVGVALLVVGLVVAAVAAPDTGVFATHSGVDSPILFGRFLVVTLLFGNALVAVVLVASIAVTSARTAIVAAIGAVLVVVVGGEAAILLGVLDGVFNEATLRLALGFVPNSAYRGLVFETVVGVLSAGESGYASPLISMIGLVLWTVASLGAAAGLLRWRIG
ncbi:ABC transporter permease [Halonotius aquaticus]|uniref:ABC transporter permease n=1 Tax=Halonotius aquaticus TaxID=2216978 RepID=A0A3A6PNF2_9EURY|nr:ABC transporter permease [Halonotius aquaticus]RJX41952.1 ABC transporter permease [Halonotius aquaticus]